MQTQRDISPKDINEEFDQLLQGLRVLLPGVQVLFAFLLTAAFSQGFAKTTDPQRIAFFIAITAVAIGAILLMAPPVHHRLSFGNEDPHLLLNIATRLTLIGTAFVGVAMVAGIYMVLNFIFGSLVSIVTTTFVALTLGIVWYVHPSLHQNGNGPPPDEP